MSMNLDEPLFRVCVDKMKLSFHAAQYTIGSARVRAMELRQI